MHSDQNHGGTHADDVSPVKLRAIFDNVPEGLITIDNQGKIEWINRAAESIFGYEPDELSGENISRLMPEAVGRKHTGYLQRYFQTGDANIVGHGPRQVTGMRKDGSPVQLELTVGEAMAIGERSSFVGIVRDVGARLEAEAQLRLSEERFRAEMEGSLDSIFYMQAVRDEQGEVVDFEFTDVNKRGIEFVNFTRSEMIGARLCELMPENITNGLFDRYKEVLESGVSLEEEHEVAMEGVKAHWVHHQLVPITNGLAFHSRDVTDRKEAEGAVLESQRQLRSVVENVPVVLFELDRHGTIKLMEGKGLEMIDVHPSRLVGKTFADLWGKESGEYRCFLRALAGEAVSYVNTANDYLFDTLYSPVRDDSGEVVGVIGVSRDVTEHQKAEDALRQAHKLKAVGQLTGGIAHDFNNLLAVIFGNLEMLAEDIPAESEAGSRIKAGLGAAERGRVLTQRLLAFSSKQNLNPRATDANELVVGMDELLRRTLPETIEISLSLNDAPWTTFVDPNQLENAILNLCLNARDAMPDGGRLGITTANETLQSARARILELSPGDYVVITVTDTGSGIKPEVMAQIFEPFYTTKQLGEGSGLGLSMVYGFVAQSEGAVNVHSEVGTGTSIEIFLPRTALVKVPEVGAPTSMLAEGRGERILVVEDNDMLRETVVRMIQVLGYVCVAVSDGNKALDLLRSDPSFDLLFTDVVLPNISGPELIRQARLEIPGLKVLLTSGYHGDKVDDRRLPLLDKPYKIAELSARLRAVLDETA